jgi:hypothetical protein
MNFPDQDCWIDQINTAWKALEVGFDIEATPQGSTHVHLSPVPGSWNLEQVKGIAKAAVYYERCIDALVPGHRRINNWCKSNRWNHRFNELSIAEIFQEIERQLQTEEVAACMCWCSKTSPTGLGLDATGDLKHYTFRWNLTSLISSKGTIEFRQPPPSTSAENSIDWIMFAVSFARWALQHGGTLDPSKPGRLDDLYQHVSRGAQLSQVRDSSFLQRLFQGVEPLQDGELHDLKGITPDEVEQLRMKAEERNIALEKYKKLFGYK